MSISNEEEKAPEGVAGPDRRDFIKVGALAGLVSAAGVAASAQQKPATPAPAAAAPPRAAGAPAGAQPRPDRSIPGPPGDIPKPKGLGPHAMLDARFPVMWEDTVPNGVRVVMQHFKALRERDMKALAATMQFPFGSYEHVHSKIVKTPEELFAAAPPSLNMSLNPQRFTDHDGYMTAGCYELFGGIEVLTWEPVMCALSMTYDRFDKNGKRLHRCEGVYIVSNNDGKWGIEMMSTIFTPDGQVGVVWKDTIEHAVRTREMHVVGDNFNPTEDINNKWAGQTEGGELNLSVSTGGNSLAFFLAREGRMMEVYRIKGVKSRLRSRMGGGWGTGENTDGVAHAKDYQDAYGKSGTGNFGFVFSDPHPRVIHHTADKAHLVTGPTRYNAQGELWSQDVGVHVVTYRKGVWGVQAMLNLSTYHDRSNDVLPA